MIEMNNYIELAMPKGGTLGDLKQFIKTCEALNIPDTQTFEELLVYMCYKAAGSELIQCGEHVGKEVYDVVIYAHDCEKMKEEDNVN